MQASFLTVSWWVWGLLALIPAVLFAFVWPKKKVGPDTTAVRYFWLRWGHSLVWLLLSVSFLLRSLPGTAASVLPNLLALAALAVYLGFVGAATAKVDR
ncbi:MAG: hypothetical protein KC441_11615 [Anaerolineales bacterium]|nr:hypothetical protein [Anaerolineales bacterium]